MLEIALTTLAIVLWSLIGIGLIVRFMESRGFEYSLIHTANGMLFKYKLGVYAGCIEMKRDKNSVIPTITQGVNGWVCKFPLDYSLKEMSSYLNQQVAKTMQSNSHSKDLIIFNEVVNKKNDSLVSINGGIYLYDNPDHKPY